VFYEHIDHEAIDGFSPAYAANLPVRLVALQQPMLSGAASPFFRDGSVAAQK
jgi:hypothetical protein